MDASGSFFPKPSLPTYGIPSKSDPLHLELIKRKSGGAAACTMHSAAQCDCPANLVQHLVFVKGEARRCCYWYSTVDVGGASQSNSSEKHILPPRSLRGKNTEREEQQPGSKGSASASADTRPHSFHRMPRWRKTRGPEWQFDSCCCLCLVPSPTRATPPSKLIWCALCLELILGAPAQLVYPLQAQWDLVAGN